MAKGYWIGHITVTDPEKYEDYKSVNSAAFSKYGGRFIVRGGDFECVSGKTRDRHVVIEFDSYQQALDCHSSPEYETACKIRDNCSENDIIVIEGT